MRDVLVDDAAVDVMSARRWRQELAQALRRRGTLVQDSRKLDLERIPDAERMPGGAMWRVVSR
jgi:hypothetical protein